ncbi:hypothetical protein C8R45DRAFT_1155661, partial [Mycena sanguinolenta]
MALCDPSHIPEIRRAGGLQQILGPLRLPASTATLAPPARRRPQTVSPDPVCVYSLYQTPASKQLIPIRAATYYTPDGHLGACGWPIQTSDMAVAIGIDNWDGRSHCGAKMTVTCDTTIEVTVADQCPTCDTDGIDLTQGAMA